MAKIKLRRDTEANWLSVDPVLALGEPGYDTTNNKLKVGDGTSTWTLLSYLTDVTGSGSATTSTLISGTYTVALSTSGSLTVPGSIIPDTDVAYDLGSPTNRFRDIYVSSSTIYIGENNVSISDNGQLLVNGANAVSSYIRFTGETLVPFTGPESDPDGASVVSWIDSKLKIVDPGINMRQALFDLKVGSVVRAEYPGQTPLFREWTVVGALEEYADSITVNFIPIPVKRFEFVISETTILTGSAVNYPGFLHLPVMEKSATIANGTWTVSISTTGTVIFPDQTVQTTAYTGQTPTLANGTYTVAISTTGNLTVSGSILPDTDVTYDLGSPTNRFRDIYVSSSTIYIGTSTISISSEGQMLVNGNDAVSKLEYFGGEGYGPRDAVAIAWNTSTFTFDTPGKELLTAIYDLKPGNKIRAAGAPGFDQEFTIVGNTREYLRNGEYQMVAIDVVETTSTNRYAWALYLPVKDKSATIANGTWTVTVSTTGTIVYPDGSVQTGASISIAQLKTLVAASTDFADFQSRIAAL